MSALVALWLSALNAAGATFPSEAPVDEDDASANLSGTWNSRAGDDPRWADAGYDDSDWKSVTLPSTWIEQGYKGMDGYVWFRREFFLDTADDGLAVMVGAARFGSYEIYAGGERIGGRAELTSRILRQKRSVYKVPRDAMDESGRLCLSLKVWRDGPVSDAFPDMGPVGNTITLGELAALHVRARMERQDDLLADLLSPAPSPRFRGSPPSVALGREGDRSAVDQ